MTSKEKEVVLRLLGLYKEMSFLWDKTHPDYTKKHCRNEGNRALLQVYKSFDPSATVKMMGKKIQNLRTNYNKELKKVKDSIRSGADPDDIYVPNIYYFDALSFLEARYSEPSCTTGDTLKSENISSDGNTRNEMQNISSDIPKRKKKKLMLENIREKQDIRCSTTSKELLNFKYKEEDWEVIGRSIGLQLRDLDKTKLRITQKIISDAIYYASIGELTRNSFIDLGPPVDDLP